MRKNGMTLKVSATIMAATLAFCGCGDNTSIEEVTNMTQNMTNVSENEVTTEQSSSSTQMDEEQKKMMAEGSSEEKNTTQDNNVEKNDNIVTIGNYEIAIKCPKELTRKSKEDIYGELIRTSYYSKTCEKDRKVNVFLPKNYSEENKYPVMYILHGIFGDQDSMLGSSNAGIPITIANMINEGLAKEMIVVFPYMYASKTQDQCTAIDVENIKAYDNFVNDLVDDLMPFMEENYSIATGKENTAITGFSMGGREALAIGLQRPDLFGYVGSISAAPGLVPGKDWAMEHPGQFSEDQLVFGEEKPFLVMVCCGDKDKTVGTFPKTYHEIFEKNGLEHIWWEIPGSDHGDPAISSGIYNFTKEVFK